MIYPQKQSIKIHLQQMHDCILEQEENHHPLILIDILNFLILLSKDRIVHENFYYNHFCLRILQQKIDKI